MASVLQFDRIAPMLRVIPSLPRPVLARLTEKLIERMDAIDGDSDLEPSGDEFDSCNGEDESIVVAALQRDLDSYGPGCAISDDGGGNVEDEGEGLHDI